MATITAAGIGSGLDVNSIITQLMQIERRPLDQLDSRKSDLNAQISAYGTLKSALSTFAGAMAAMGDTGKFQPYAATSSNEAAVAVSLGDGAGPGSYVVNVTQLASSHKLASGPYASDAAVGEGTLAFTVGAQTFSVAIDATNHTLTGIRDAINQASGNSTVSASIINATGGARLVLTSRESGAAGAISVAVTGDADGNDTDAAGLSALAFVAGGAQNLTQLTAGQDALLTIDGFAVASASNDVVSAVDGVSFSLEALGSSTVTVDRDDSAITKAAQDYAKAYNDLMAAIDKLREGELGSDSSLRTVESSLTAVFQTGANVGGIFSYLSEVGVSLDRYGKMQVDTARLTASLGNNPSNVISLFTHETEGFPARLEAVVESLTRSDGLIAGREEGLNSRIRSMDSQRVQLERRLEITESRLRAQYAALDSLVAQMQSTSAYLAQNLYTYSKS